MLLDGHSVQGLARQHSIFSKEDLIGLELWPFNSADEFMNALKANTKLRLLQGTKESSNSDIEESQTLGHALVLQEPNEFWTTSDSAHAREKGVLHHEHWDKIKKIHIIMPNEDQTYFSTDFHKVVHYGIRVEHVQEFVKAIEVIGLQHFIYTAGQ